VRTVSARYAPDPDRLAMFAQRIRESKNPVLIYGQEIDRSGGWDTGVTFAEQLQAPVYLPPLPDRASFPETHPQFRGALPVAIGPLSKRLKGHDLVIVIGAEVFRYYPYIAGEYLPEGTDLLQITEDPAWAAKAVAGDSLLSDAVVPAAKGFGCTGALAKTKEEIKQAFSTALKADGPTLIAIPIAREDRPLVAPVRD